jgi:O-antigen/teichoic acid export membrane protein
MAATYASQILAFGIGLLTKALLGPTDLGLWTVLLSALSFLNLLELGVIQAANKEIAYALSKGDEQAAQRYKRTQFTFVTLTALVGTVAVAGYAWLHVGSDSALSLGLLAMAVLLPFYQIHLGQVTVFWANHKFAATSLLIIFETLLAGSVGLFLIWHGGLAGQVASFVLILFAKLGVLAWHARGTPRLRIAFGWDADALKHLLRLGLPLQIINLSNVLKLSGTVFLIAHFFNAEAVGIYAFALSVQNFVYWTPNAFSIVMFPRFQELYAKSNDEASALHSYLTKPVIGLAFFLLPLLITTAYFFVSVLIEYALPAYRASIDVLAVMLLGTYFLSLEHMPGQLLTTANRLWQRVGLSALNVALIGICIAVAISLQWGLIGVVAGLSFANAAMFLIAFIYAHAVAGAKQADRWLVAKLIAAFLYFVAVVGAIENLLPASHGHWLNALTLTFAKWLLSLGLMLPLFAYAERQLGLIKATRDLIADRLGTRR